MPKGQETNVPGLIKRIESDTYGRTFLVKVMAKDSRITLILEGVPEAEGRIRLNTFVAELQRLSAVLGKVSRETLEGKPATVYNIVELSYNSPMRVVVAPAPGSEHVASLVLQRFETVADAVTTGKTLDSYDADLLEDLRALAKPVGNQLQYATLLINDVQYEMNDAVTRRVDTALAVDEECIGFIEGRLEQINIHEGANMFHIYPDVGPRKVACHFPSALLDDAIFAVGRRVEVTGTMKYRQGASFAHAIAVTAIDSFPPEDELPTWEDLRGRAPNATGELSSEAFVRELRDAWS
jgi:hypothetical protein